MTIAVENISGGMGGTAFIGYMSTLCSPGYAGTQYAMLSALALSGRNVFSTITGIVADQVGWTWFFITSTAVGIPGLLILVWLMRNTPAESSEPVAP
jgi:PAT family beta-lactamase induction signal transducer AmpG